MTPVPLAGQPGFSYTATFTDIPNWTNDFTSAPTTCAAAVLVTFTAADQCGNTVTTQAEIQINDNIAPEIPAIPADLVLGCGDEIPSGQMLTAIDACSGEVEATPVDSEIIGECPGSRIITRVWTFTDGCNNTVSASQTITISDTTAPVFTFVPEDITAECGTAPAFGIPVASDACGGAIDLSFTDATVPGSCSGSSIITRTWTATDACNNQATASQTVSLTDATAPVITTPASNIEITCADGTDQLAAWLASNGGAVAVDACSDIVWTNDYDGQTGSCGTAITVTFTATDGCGNSSTTAADFTIIDTVAPVAPVAPETLTVDCATAVPAPATLTATDACSGEITATGIDVVTPGNCANNFTIVRTWTFTDQCG
ncbi:MAG: hypothetical protein EOP49_44995, partial [Sphingobacteriales bacterium]